MTDLDFDELDKAVNSLMADAPSPVAPPPKQDDGVNTITLPDSAVPQTDSIAPSPTVSKEESVEPLQDKQDTAEESSLLSDTPTDTAPKDAAPSLATKRSGRFMDVVHPSSDMRKSSTFANRSARGVTPLNPNVTAETSAPAESLTSEESSSTDPEVTASSETSWPDPIDMHEQQQAATPEISTPAQDDTPTPADTVPETPPADVPTEENESSSPFLADAKVEKRPLGGGSDAPVPGTTPVERAPDPLPAELNSDVLAIESNGGVVAAKEDLSNTSVEDQEVPEPASLEGGTTEPAPAPSGPVSIAQQYKSEASTGDPSHAPLYDSVADPHALTHPAKKRSGLWVVLAIIALIAIGAGIGAFAYFQGMI